MSRYADILQKAHGQLGDLQLESFGAGEERLDEAFQRDQVRVEEVRVSQIPVEEVQVEASSRIVLHSDPRSPGADRFRFLRMQLRALWDAGKLKRLLVTSPLPQDGKSTIALNLATALAEQGKRSVLLVEGDLHHPTLIPRLGLKAWPGLAECLEEGLNPMSAVRRIEPLGWYLLPAGKPQSNPTELLQSRALSSIMQEISSHFDWVVIDSPPVNPLTDALSLAQHADASLLVVRAGCTPREAVEEALALLGPEHLQGIVLNGIEGLNRLYSKYRGYYDK
jgi:capsular exopolysaccharide synthesis family protein